MEKGFLSFIFIPFFYRWKLLMESDLVLSKPTSTFCRFTKTRSGFIFLFFVLLFYWFPLFLSNFFLVSFLYVFLLFRSTSLPSPFGSHEGGHISGRLVSSLFNPFIIFILILMKSEFVFLLHVFSLFNFFLGFISPYILFLFLIFLTLSLLIDLSSRHRRSSFTLFPIDSRVSLIWSNSFCSGSRRAVSWRHIKKVSLFSLLFILFITVNLFYGLICLFFLYIFCFPPTFNSYAFNLYIILDYLSIITYFHSFYHRYFLSVSSLSFNSHTLSFVMASIITIDLYIHQALQGKIIPAHFLGFLKITINFQLLYFIYIYTSSLTHFNSLLSFAFSMVYCSKAILRSITSYGCYSRSYDFRTLFLTWLIKRSCNSLSTY